MPALGLILQAQEPPPASTIFQAIIGAMLVIFVFSVATTLFITKKLDGVAGATFLKAFGATLFKNMLFWPTFFISLTLQGMPVLGAFALGAGVVPIVVYKLFYGSTWRAAAVIWFVVFVVEFAVGYGLTTAGMLSLEAFA